ncbi:hypothetical protein V8C34DRAFT_299870 [Trichoderma compactum]
MPRPGNAHTSVPGQTDLAHILQDAAAINFDDEASKHAIATFSDTHRVRLSKSNSKGEILHHMLSEAARGDQKLSPKLRSFTGWVCRERANLLSCIDDAGFTPIHFALKTKFHQFVEVVLDNLKDDTVLLELTDGKGWNCLHWAIEESSPYALRIIERAKAHKKKTEVDIFLVMNDENETPLHTAMMQEEPDTPGVHKVPLQTLPAESKNLPNESSSSAESMNATIRPRQLTRTPTYNTAVQYNEVQHVHDANGVPVKGLGFDLMEVVRNLIADNDSILHVCGPAKGKNGKRGKTPYQTRVGQLQEEVNKELEDKGEAEKKKRLRRKLNEDKRARYIRHYAIRNFNRRDALSALYQAGEERVIEFDLSALGKQSVEYSFLPGLAAVLDFEELLSYVALPARFLVKDENGEPVEHEHEAPAYEKDETFQEDIFEGSSADQEDRWNSRGKGTSHYCEVFQWLTKQGVLSIHNVIVFDDIQPSHSDVSIQCCLERFDVQVWNWKRFDISADVILKSAPNVIEVTLYSSGNNAVLQGWASDTGLKTLKKLEKVQLYIQEGLEMPTLLRRYVKEFREKLEGHFKDRDFEFHWGRDNPSQSFMSGFGKPHTRLIPINTNPWFTYMKGFARFLENVNSPNTEDIKIAIIDTGINPSLEIFKGKIQVGDSFHKYGAISGRKGAYYVASGPHGTLMAQLICEVCPRVKLYVAQIEEIPAKDTPFSSFTHESATEAINWAVARGVDIISMSWSIEADRRLDDLETALNNALEAKTILFCSATDQGRRPGHKTYPAEIMKSTANRIRVGASTGTGEKLTWVSEPDTDFHLPGENVQPAEPDQWLQGLPYGSSISTALAAGLAGVLLYCDRLLNSWKKDMPQTTDQGELSDDSENYSSDDNKEPEDTSGPAKRVDALREHGAMRKAFKNLSARTEYEKFPDLRNHARKDPTSMKWDSRDPVNSRKSRNELKELLKFLKK